MSAFGSKADMTLASQSVGLPKPKLDLFQFESLANAYLGCGHHHCGRLVFLRVPWPSVLMQIKVRISIFLDIDRGKHWER
jgi:hypothetical protein